MDKRNTKIEITHDPEFVDEKVKEARVTKEVTGGLPKDPDEIETKRYEYRADWGW